MTNLQQHMQTTLPHHRKMMACVAGACAAAALCAAVLYLPDTSDSAVLDGGSASSALVRPAYAAESDFIFPRSSYELLTEEDVEGCSAYELYLARNEIFARHGYIFVNEDLKARFSSMDWYVPLYPEAEFRWGYLNWVEQANIALIQQQEAILEGNVQSPDYIFPTSSYSLLTESDLQECTAYELYLARNEIFARHGYIFVNDDLNTYFRSKAWYTPLYTESEFNWNWLSEIEQENVALIQEREDALATATQSTASAYPQTTVISDDIGTVTVSANGHVTTDYYSFDIPEFWLEFVTITCTSPNGYPFVTVSYKDHSDLTLIRLEVVDADAELNGGDIGNGLIAYWYNGRGQRIEMWARNYVYISQWPSDYYPSEFDEAALIDLSTGGTYTVETARASNQGNGSDNGYDYYRNAIVPTVQAF